MKNDDSWSARWSCEKLINHTNIIAAKPLGPNEIELTLRHGRKEPVKVATLAKEVVTKSELDRVYRSVEIEFIMNIPKEAIFQREAIEMSELLGFGLGGLGDLYVAADECEFQAYVPKELRFVLKALKQHSHVSRVIRMNNRLVIVERNGKEDMRVLALNEYDLTADAVRTGIEKFGLADVILTSNPNCRPSVESIEAAKSTGADVFSIGELMSNLRQ